MPQPVPSQIVALIDRNLTHINAPAGGVTHSTVGVFAAVARLVDETPPELLTISGTDYDDLVCGVEAIRTVITFWEQKGIGVVGQPSVGAKKALDLVRTALSKCPDQIPSPATADLTFIADVDLRNSIRLDISTATSALHNREWKASTVLAGSAAEALLLWAISNSPNLASVPNSASLDNWSLGQYITTAEKLGLIKGNTATQARLAQNFRNLVHPGRSQRLGEACDRGTALTALAAVEHIVRDLI
jgi:hypothetical protein